MAQVDVLLIDDNQPLLDSVSRYLQHRGMNVMTSATPLGARALILQHAPAVVVLDVMMPALDGEKLAHLIQSSPANKARIVFYSAMDEEQLRRIALRLPRCTYVSKADGVEALHRAVVAARNAK
jgi:DNA-binding response OmpR family regulator